MKRLVLILLFILLLLGVGSELEVDKNLRREMFIKCTDKIPRELMDLENGSYADAVDKCNEIVYERVK